MGVGSWPGDTGIVPVRVRVLPAFIVLGKMRMANYLEHMWRACPW